MPQSATRHPLVGRETELRQVRQEVADSRSGSPRIVVVTGEAGVGKSSLWRELMSASDALAVTGHCLPLQGEAIPFAPVIGTLRGICRTLDIDQLAGLLAHWPSEFDSLLPAGVLSRDDAQASLRGNRDPAPSRSAQSRLFESLLSLLDDLTRTAPLVWLVEDVHWADRSTLDLLAFLARNLSTERVLIGLTVRTDDLHREHPLRGWLHELSRVPCVTRIDLPRLSRAATGQQLRAIAGATGSGPVDEALVDAVFDRSAGNPLFTEELVPWTGDPRRALPETLRDLVAARLARLDAPVRRLLQVAAVVGTSFDVDLLAAVAGAPEQEVERAVETAVDRHLLVTSGGSTYALVHPIFGEVLEADLLAGTRRRLHEAAARVLTARTGDLEGRFEAIGMIAHHWEAAQQPGPALSAAVRAGVVAQQLCAFAEADDYYGRALELSARADVAGVPRDLGDADLLLHASEVAHLVGDDHRAIQLVDRAVDLLPDPDRRSEALERKGTYCFHGGRPAEGEKAFGAALALLPPGPSQSRARVLSGIGLLATGWTRLGLAKQVCTEAIAVARAAGARREEGRALNALGVATALDGDLPGGIECSRQAVAIAEAVADPDDLSLAYINLTHLLSLAGECDEALAVLDRGYQALSSVGLARQEGSFLLANVAEGLERTGRWTEASALLDRALAQHPKGLRGFPVLEYAARLKVHQGDLTSAESLVALAQQALAEHAPPDSWRRELIEVDAELRLWLGDPTEARAVAEQGLALAEGGDEARFGGALFALVARALADLRDDPVAGRDVPALVAALRTRAESTTPSPFDGAAHPLPDGRAVELTLRAELARAEGDRAVLDLWLAAAQAWESVGRPFAAAYARWRDAEAQVLTKQVGERPVAAVRRAHAAAVALGAARLVAEVEMLALWGRVDLVEDRPPEPEPAYPGLTAREVEILHCLMAGKTNREIAESLFISVKTVSVHVSNILRKQGVSSREEAARLGHLRAADRPGARSPGAGRR